MSEECNCCKNKCGNDRCVVKIMRSHLNFYAIHIFCGDCWEFIGRFYKDGIEHKREEMKRRIEE